MRRVDPAHHPVSLQEDAAGRVAEESGLRERCEAMFRGEKLNTTEGRAVLHVALRAPRDREIRVDGRDVVPLRWRRLVLSCRPAADPPVAPRPRPRPLWPTDLLALAERLLLVGRTEE